MSQFGLYNLSPPDTKPQCFEDLVNFLLMIYSRMRGKYFAMKLLKKNAVLKLPVCQLQAVLSDPKSRMKQEDKALTDEERQHNEEFAKIARELALEDDE